MSTPSRHLCRHLLRTLHRSQPRSRSIQPRILSPIRQRQFASTIYRRDDADPNTSTDIDISQLSTPTKPLSPTDLTPDERATYDTLNKTQQTEYMAIQNHILAVASEEDLDPVTEAELERAAGEIDRENVFEFTEEKKASDFRDQYWSADEDDELGYTPDGDDEVSEENITSVAESELELHREIREYTRIAAWDLPLLLQYTKSFSLPDMKQTPLRFRYTTYLGEIHPAASKVALEFTVKELAASAGLTQVQTNKLIKVMGARYNPDKDLVKMSCEKFENQAQNKRYLGDLVNKVIAESKTGDMFEDVPFDFRHHTSKVRPVFPESWAVGQKDGVQRLSEAREQLKSLEPVEEQEVQPVNGGILMEEYVRTKQTAATYMRR